MSETTPPKRIYLQWPEDGEADESTTWSDIRSEDADVEYVLAATVESQAAEIAELREALRLAMRRCGMFESAVEGWKAHDAKQRAALREARAILEDNEHIDARIGPFLALLPTPDAE